MCQQWKVTQGHSVLTLFLIFILLFYLVHSQDQIVCHTIFTFLTQN